MKHISGKRNNISTMAYPSAVMGAALMMLLRLCDDAGILSAVLAIAGMAAFIYSLRHAHLKTEYVSAAGAMAAAYAVRFYGYTGQPAADILLGLLTGLIVFALMALERLAKKYEDRFWYTLIFPVLYFLFMYFTETVKINMPFRMDIYLSCFPVLCQITALLGVYFLDFLVMWTASSLAFLLGRGVLGQKCVLAVLYVCLLAGVLCFGGAHRSRMLAQEAAKTDTVRVAMATGPYYGSFSDASYDGITAADTAASLTAVVQEAAEQHAEVLVFSEEAYCVRDWEEASFLEEAERLAAASDMHVLLAYEVEDCDGSEGGKGINKLCWISGEGQVLADYTKHCLVPLIEASDYVKGNQTVGTFDIDVHGRTLKAAAAICYDADFDLFMSHMDKDTDLLFLPTWDWDVVAAKHLRVARLRAVSRETTVVRCAYDGWNAVISSAGDILWRGNTNDTGYEHVLVYDVPVR